MKIGFIGQGYVGKNIANDIESRDFTVVRYALEPQYVGNKDIIKTCDITFVAVPTPTTPEGFDPRIIEESLALLGDGSIAVIKSTILPGTTKRFQEKYPNITVLCSPEFLCESTAAHDAAHPILSIVGIPTDSDAHKKAAEKVMDVIAPSSSSFIVPSNAAELFKYIHNIHGYMRVVFSNVMFDTAEKLSVQWKDVEQLMNVDPMMSPYYNAPVHKSGRGAGGHCFIKDMAAFRKLFEEINGNDALGNAVIKTMEAKNLDLLKSTNKDSDLVEGVYGVKNQTTIFN
jgi:UDPglucose 6-dehydrogenase